MKRDSKVRRRPAYPSPSRQAQGIIATLAVIASLEYAASKGVVINSPGGVLLIVAMLVPYWSGLRTGFICCGISLAYLIYAYSIPGTLLHYEELNQRRLLSAFILVPAFCWLVGSLQGRMLKAAIREYDANASADEATAHRRQTEGELKSSQELQRAVVDSAMDAIVAIDDRGKITLWNAAAANTFGWSEAEALDCNLSELIIPPDFRDQHRQGLERLLEGGEATVLGRRLELSGLAKDGRIFPIELTVIAHQSNGKTSFIGFLRDVSEQKRLNARLRQGQKMEAIGTFAGGIAHDFNNILSAIAGNAALAMADAPPDHQIRESLVEIDKAVARAADLVRRLLTFSNATESDMELVDTRLTVENAVKLLSAALPATMEIETHFDPDLPPINVNSTDVHQLVLNLGINAHHATLGSVGMLEISAKAVTLDESQTASLLQASPGRFVQLTFKDHGCGMAPDVANRIFEPFFTTKSQGEGTGLGLSVVYGIVERHNGAITVTSEPGLGTEFSVYLPAAIGTVTTREVAPENVAAGRGERILYIDDDEALVFMMTRVLRRLNYDLVGYEHPEEGLKAFKQDPNSFDLVITDLSMPKMDGSRLVREVQSIRPDTPIVMVTGYIRPSDLEIARDLGLRKLLLKPNTVHEMADAIHAILSDIRAGGTGDVPALESLPK